MQSNLMKHKVKIITTIFIVLCFGLIRTFERELFYDPFLEYFEMNYKTSPIPQVDFFKLFCGLFLRYFLNTVLSLILIYTLFRDKEILRFSTFLYVFFMVILFVFIFVLLNYFPDANWLLFYVRRFIIQPVFVLLFIPAFYYQQLNFKK